MYTSKKKPVVKPPAGKPKPGSKPPAKNLPGIKAVKDSTIKAPPLAKDSILKVDVGKLPNVKTAKDSSKKDSSIKVNPAKMPGMKMGKDTVKH